MARYSFSSSASTSAPASSLWTIATTSFIAGSIECRVGAGSTRFRVIRGVVRCGPVQRSRPPCTLRQGAVSMTRIRSPPWPTRAPPRQLSVLPRCRGRRAGADLDAAWVSCSAPPSHALGADVAAVLLPTGSTRPTLGARRLVAEPLGLDARAIGAPFASGPAGGRRDREGFVDAAGVRRSARSCRRFTSRGVDEPCSGHRVRLGRAARAATRTVSAFRRRRPRRPPPSTGRGWRRWSRSAPNGSSGWPTPIR